MNQGSTSLPHLLSTLHITMHPSTFIYLHFPHSSSSPSSDDPHPASTATTSPPVPSTLYTHALIREAEGITIITTVESARTHDLHLPNKFPLEQVPSVSSSGQAKAAAAAATLPPGAASEASGGVTAMFPCRMLTCAVHSALECVGFMAALSTELARAGIACNVLAGFFHDHLLVKVGDEGRAVECLENLARGANTNSSE